MEKLPICRICLAENVRMYVVVNRNLHKLYEKLTDIPFVTEDIRPILACYFCCTKLKQCYQLLRQCLKAEELFTQRMNEDYETNPLINQNHLEFFSGFVKSPIVHTSIVDECQADCIAVKDELPAVCEGLDDIFEPKEELHSYELELDLYNSCVDVADIPPHHSESDSKDDVSLMTFKIEVEEEQEVSQKKRTASETTNVDRGTSSRGSWRDRGCVLGHGGLSNAPQRPAPSTIDALSVCNISEMPGSWGLETALHSKRMRMSQPFMECGESKLPPNLLPASPTHHLSAHPRRGRHLTDAEIDCFMGSDAESDESGDEEVLAFPGIPRMFRSVMETPLDQDTAEDPEPAADPLPAVDPAPAGDPAPADVPQVATYQPKSWYEFDWRAFPNPQIPPESRRETFSQSNVGPTTPFGDPYDIFIAIWDRQIMEHIASETNKYAQQLAALMLDNRNLHPNSRIGQWYDTTADELYVYLAIILAMGVVVKSRLEDYWSATHDIFYTPGFSAYMSINRFMLLSKCLHFSDNNDMYALDLEYSEAKLFKIQPVLSHLNKKFQDMYTPSQNISLDESLLMCKGWLEISQLIPNKKENRGIKTYEICESQTGYLWRFEVHAQKKSTPQLYEYPLEAPTSSIVLRLTKGLEHKGYTLWMDNFYNSPCLARRLKCLGFDCVGTLRTDRKFVPQALHSLTKRCMRPGQVAGLTSGDVDVMVWRDSNRVAMISTYHGTGQHTVRGSTKPILILDYNIMMGGVDKKDQLLARYPIERKRTRVWYKKLFRRLVNVSVLNAFIIHQHNSTLSHRNFRIRLIKSLLSKHSTSQVIPPAPIQNKPVDISHRLTEFPMGPRQRKRRKCVQCKKLVGTFCTGCSKAVCMNPCFPMIHS